MKKWFVVLMVPFLFALVSCKHQMPPNFVENPVVKNLPERQQHLLADIERSGIQVIKQGMRFTFVIPTDSYFDIETRDLKEKRDLDIDRLATFIKLYTAYFVHPRITVAAYSDKVWEYYARKKMTMHYATVIATLLQEDGVSDIISVRGQGAKDPIASNQYPMGTAFNKRVMVTIH